MTPGKLSIEFGRIPSTYLTQPFQMARRRRRFAPDSGALPVAVALLTLP